MALTIGSLANMQTQSAMAIGQAQSSSLGLGETEGNALAITNMMEQGEDNSLIGKLMGSGGTQNRLRGSAFKQDLQDIAGAAVGNSLSSGIGSIVSTKV